MKKIIKSLSLICLAFLMVCPLVLSGCARNYTIAIDVAGGEGFVLEKGYDQGKNLAGLSTTVKQGEKFEFLIKPNTGYEIAKIEIDGSEYTNYNKNEHYLSFENVDGNHTVVVTFARIYQTIEFQCMGAGNTYVKYDRTITTGSGSVILSNGQISLPYGTTIDLKTNFAYGTGAGKVEWVLYNSSTQSTISLSELQGVVLIQGDRTFRTTLTAEELDVIFGI